MASTIEIFCCYAHKDQSFLKHLRNHLTLFQKQGLINLWFDVDISPGTIWEEEIQKHLETAQIILLLISPNFMASEYCYSNEMKRALERHEQGCARVIPIVLRPVHWQLAPFGKLQALPKDAKPVKSWRDQDKAFVDVVTGILSAVEQMTIRSPKTAEINLVKPSKTPEVPLIKTSDSVLSPTLSQLSAISMSTPSSPTVSEDKQRFLALKEGEQALQYKPDWDNLSPPIVDFKDDTLPELSPVRRKTEVSKGRARSNEPTLDELDWDDLPPPIEDCEDDNQAAEQSNAGLPLLTVRQVRNAWDRIVKRVRQRSPTTAAMLKYYDIVGVEDMAGQFVIAIQAQKQGHYNYVNEQDHSKDVEWALTTEFSQNCWVRLLSPGTPLEPHLFLQLVQERWDRVKKRVKQRSPTTAAMLKYYDIVGVEGAAGLTVIVIRAQKQGHYNYVNEQGRSKDVEWALTTEFGQNCRVRLLPPGTPLDHSV